MSFKAGNYLRFAEALVAISIYANAFAADAQVAPDIASTSGSGSATPSLPRQHPSLQPDGAGVPSEPAGDRIHRYLHGDDRTRPET